VLIPGENERWPQALGVILGEAVAVKTASGLSKRPIADAFACWAIR
jgi:hypothetical protein